jgi:uncharacterized iron-regulated membrane protein
MDIKKVTGKIHLWLGLLSGLLVFIIAITGSLYVFQEEIQNLTQPFRHIEVQDKPFLPPSQLLSMARKELPGKSVHAVKYNGKDKAAEVIFYQYSPSYYYTVYLNPYDSRVLKVYNSGAGFFRFIIMGHYYLWLPPDIGKPVVATTTLVFVVMLISGWVLWFPKRLSAIKRSLVIIWEKGTHWKRKIFDWHNVLGFYAGFIALILALTGLIWGFQWFADNVYKGAGGQKSLLYNVPVVKVSLPSGGAAIDRVWLQMQAGYPGAQSIEVHVPENDSAAIAVNVNWASSTYWKTDYRYFDPYTLKEVPVDHIYGRLRDAGFADKMIRMNYDIHTGAIGGLAGKILVFFVGLVVASLPVTGFIIWRSSKK